MGLAPLTVVSFLCSPAAARAEGVSAAEALQASTAGGIRAVEAALAAAPPESAAAHLLQARRSAMRDETSAYRAALARYFGSGDRDPALLREAFRLAAETEFANGDYAIAGRAAAQLAALEDARRASKEAEDARQILPLAQLLQKVTPQRVEQRGAATVPAERDKVGLLRVTFTVNGNAQEGVFDTGANLSVASESAARKLGLRALEGAASIGNSVKGTIPTKVGIADRLEFGGAVFRNVVFLILSDAQLDFPVPGGYRMDAILGLPVIRELGRIRVGPGKQMSIAPSDRRVSAHSNLRLVGSEPFVDVRVGEAEVPLFLDTGANNTSLSARFAANFPRSVAGFKKQTDRRAGVGGSTTSDALVWEKVPTSVGGTAVTLPRVRVQVEGPADSGNWGVLGSDFLRRLLSFTLDFGTMRLETEAAKE